MGEGKKGRTVSRKQEEREEAKGDRRIKKGEIRNNEIMK